MKCRLCGKSAGQCGGWLERQNELGVVGVWECRPSCESQLDDETALIMAINDEATAAETTAADNRNYE